MAVKRVTLVIEVKGQVLRIWYLVHVMCSELKAGGLLKWQK